MDLVSIIIPVYNVEAYLDRCIASAVGQTYPNIEIILVDDGSTDRCPEICDSWAQKDRRVSVVHQQNRGVSAARNAGLHAASGSYILQLDSDDYLAPYAVEQLLTTAQETSADMVVCDFVKGSDEAYCFSEPRPVQPMLIDYTSALYRIYCGNHEALRFVAPWCRLCRRSLYDGILYPDGKIFEDIYTTHKLICRCKQLAVLDAPLFYYYQRPDSIMNASFHIRKLDYLQALVERVDFFSGHQLQELAAIAYDELLHSLIWEYSRTRDVLHSQEGMAYVTELYRQVYRKGHSSKRYPQENRWFLAAFFRNPEWIILYWRVKGKLNRLKPKK